MLEQKELYIVELADGRKMNAVAETFKECIDALGEENIVSIRKIDDYKEAE